MACERCDPAFSPIVKLDDGLLQDCDALSFYSSRKAGAFTMKRGYHGGKFLRDVPECYLCFNEMTKTYEWLLEPARAYLAGLRQLEENLGIARTAVPVEGPAASEPWYTADDSGGHVMEFGRYTGTEIRDIPLEYLLWTRADFSKTCVNTEMGKKHLSALDKYIMGLEKYMTSTMKEQKPLLSMVTTNDDGSKMKTCYIAQHYNGPTTPAKNRIYFRYYHLKNAGKPSVTASALTKTLFANINALTQSQLDNLTAIDSEGPCPKKARYA